MRAAMKSKAFVLALLLASVPLLAQESPRRRPAQTPAPAPQPSPSTPPSTPRSTEPEPPARAQQMEREQQQPAREREAERPQQTGGGGASSSSFHFDMKETPASVTHHQVTVKGRALHYTATAGRMPIKNGEGVTEALLFYVAYTLDGAEAATRPVPFAYNGGPGSAPIRLQ